MGRQAYITRLALVSSEHALPCYHFPFLRTVHASKRFQSMLYALGQDLLKHSVFPPGEVSLPRLGNNLLKVAVGVFIKACVVSR